MLNDFDRKLEKIRGFKTNYVKLLYYDLAKNFSGSYRTYNYVRFAVILSGEESVTLKNKKIFTYGENDFLLLSANTKVQIDVNVDTKFLVFELSDHLIEEVFSKVDLDEKTPKGGKEKKDYYLGHNKWNISRDMIEIFETHRSKEKNSGFLIDLYIQKIVFDLMQNKSAHSILKSDWNNPINTAIRYINNNIHTAINIGELAEDLYMSESNFSHLFKKNIEMTPGEYIKDKKLELARQYLKTDNVTNVAYNLGYKNISYFIKIFKQKYKHTPKQYKMMHYDVGIGASK